LIIIYNNVVIVINIITQEKEVIYKFENLAFKYNISD